MLKIRVFKHGWSDKNNSAQKTLKRKALFASFDCGVLPDWYLVNQQTTNLLISRTISCVCTIISWAYLCAKAFSPGPTLTIDAFITSWQIHFYYWCICFRKLSYWSDLNRCLRKFSNRSVLKPQLVYKLVQVVTNRNLKKMYF